MSDLSKFGFSTQAVHAGENPFNGETGADGDVAVPIHLATTFARKVVSEPTNGWEYTRTSNPTRRALENKLAAIEGAEFAAAFGSGLAAATTLLLALLHQGDQILASDDLYGGTKRLFNNVFSQYGFETVYVDASFSSIVERNINPRTKLIWIESPSNPLLKLVDIKAIAKIAHDHNVILVVDNTFLSPYFQLPLALEADVVVYSSTKYIGGHSDVLGGAVLTSDRHLADRIYYHQNAAGAVLSPFDSYLTLRGIKTLALRMERHQQNALTIARWLEVNEKVERVLYPGLDSHPQHLLAKTQQKGFGGVLSFVLKGGKTEAEYFVQHLHLISLAESLGGVESLVEIPAQMTHSSIPPEVRRHIGISDSLIRLSVGVEDVKDLIADIEQALPQ